MGPPASPKDDGVPPPESHSGGPAFPEDDDDVDDAVAPSKVSPAPSPSLSLSPPREPSASPPPAASNGRIKVSLTSQPERQPSPADSPSPTTLEPAPLQVLALAVPSQNPFSGGPNFSGSSGGGGGGGGREDYWTESATEVLIDAWAERYVCVTKGSLKQNNWKEVADIVNGSDDRSRVPRTDVQCKNRIDTVKKKYKIEKARVEAGGGRSSWKFFEKMDRLLGHTVATGMKTNAGAVTGGKGQRSKSKSRNSGWGRGWESEGDEEDDEEEEEEKMTTDRLLLLPPLPPPPSRRNISETQKKKGAVDGYGEQKRGMGMGMALVELTRAIESFGEVYEKTERAKIREVMEMEKQRMKFAKEMEVQRMQFFMKTQVEIAKHVNKKPRRDTTTTTEGDAD